MAGMPGMMPSPGMPSGMMKPMAPKPQQVVKPVRPSIPESPLMVALRRELVKRSGSNVIVRTVTENIVIFDRLTSDGQSSTYRVAYNFQDGEFMFGKPERVQAQTVYSPAETERTTPMENFNVSIKPQADAYMGDDPEEFIAMPGKSEDFDFDGFDFDDLEAKVGRALNNRNLSKLKTVMEMLQDIVASAEKEKEVEVKEYIIEVDVKDAFHTKQLLDPIMDYHRVDSYVSEKGIVVTSGITPEFIDAVETLKKGIGNRIGRGGGGGKGRRLARGAASFDPKAWDGDGDGLVQEGTPFQRPAIPGVNDQASRGRGTAGLRSSISQSDFDSFIQGRGNSGFEGGVDSFGNRARMAGEYEQFNKYKNRGGKRNFEKWKESNEDSWMPRERGLRSSTEDSPIPERSQVFGGFDELDSSVLNFRMLGNSLKETAKNLGISEAQVRQREIAELKRLRESGTDKDLLAYRLNGLSLTDTAKLFNTTPEKVRQREAKEMARMRKDASDMDISDYRNRGVSLDSMAELLGTTRQNVRKREMRPVPPDPPMTNEQLDQMARDMGMQSSTRNPRPLSMTLSNDEIGELRDEIPLLKKYSSGSAALDSLDEKLKNAKNGKIELTSAEAEALEKEVGSAFNNSDGKIVTSDIDGVLGQVVESTDGKYVSPNWEEQQAGGRGNLGMRSKTPNNGAPPQIDEARQKKLIFFMNSAEGGRLGVSRRIREQYAKRGDGTMPARDWKALNTLYGNRTGDKLPIETERFRDGREDGGGMRSSTEESVGRDRSAGMSVSALGEVGRERGSRGRSIGGGEDVSVGAKRYSGKKFNDVKPDNWDEMSNDDKFEWMFNNSPEKSGISSIEYDREIEKLLKEEDLAVQRQSRKQRIAESAASGEKPEAGSIAEQRAAKPKGVKVTPRPDNEKDAAKQRKDDYSLLEKAIDKQIGDVTKLNDKGRVDQMHVDAWDEIGEIMDSDDLSRNQIKATIQRLKNYLEDVNEADEAEGSAEKIVEAARKLLKTMQVMDTYYGKDKFIADGPEINITPRSGAAGRQLADVSDDAFDVDSVGGMRSRVPVNAGKVVSSSVKDYVASRSSRNSGLRSSTGRAGRTEIKEEATFFKDILDSLPREISEAKKNNDRKTSQALEKLSQIINRQEAAKLGDKRTNAGRILLTRDEVDEVLDAVMMVIDRQGAKGGGARQEKFAKFIDMLAKAAMATFIDRTVEELGGRTTTRQTSRGRSVEIQDL
jgi:DNA-binding CsgD family transcriptional regulator